MGASCTQSKKTLGIQNVQEQPKQAQSFNHPNPSELQFELQISNIKVKNLQGVSNSSIDVKSITLQLSVDPFLDKVLEAKPVADTLKWKVTQRALMKLTKYQLCKRYLIINIFSENRQIIAGLKLNLYQISVGPYHQDFLLKASDKRHARISMDVKISQIVQVDIQPNEIKVEMNTQHPGESFHYTLKVTNEDGTEFQSATSYNAETKLYSKIQGNSEVLQPRSAMLRKRQSLRPKRSIILQLGKNLMWTSKQSQDLHQTLLPGVQMYANVSKISSYGFKILLWKVKAEVQGIPESQLQQEVELYSESHISLDKILMQFSKIETLHEESKNIGKVALVEKIWSQGKLQGSIRITCEVTIPEFMKQLLGCVRTENGISSITPSLQVQTTTFGNSSTCPEIKKLIQIKKIQQNEFTKLNTEEYLSQFKTLSIKRNLMEGFSKISTLLEISTNKYKMIYNYKSEEDLFKGQVTLLDIGFKLLECLRNDDANLVALCWKAFILLINRQQFNLNYIGVNESDKLTLKQTQQGNFSKSLVERINLRLKYQNFLYQTLRTCLNSLADKTNIEHEQAFVILFCAQAFFRIPQFRQYMIEHLQKPDDAHRLDQMGLSLSRSSIDVSLKMYFDWSENFYEPLQNLSGFKQNQALLKQILENSDYKDRFRQRGTNFFCFTVECVSYVQRLSHNQTKSIYWFGIPGYIQLIKAFFCELHARKIEKMPDIMRQASTRLLNNQQLLNIFLKITFNKTNVFAKMEVYRTLELIDSYFKYMSKNQTLPASFDQKFFYSGLKIILETEHSFLISKCLELIYNHYTLFSMTFRHDISMLLLGKQFFRLFLHWSHLVRQAFHNLLVYRVNLDCNYSNMQKQPRFDESQLKEVHQRYDKVLIILKNARKIKSSNQLSLTSLHHLYYKQMKYKLVDIRLSKGLRNAARKKSDHMENLLTLSSLSISRTMSENSPTLNHLTQVAHHNSVYLEVVREPRQRKNSTNLSTTYEQEPMKERQPKRTRIISSVYDLDQQLNQSDLRQLVEYIENSLSQFSNIDDLFKKTMVPSFNHKDAPAMHIRIPVDKGDIRPDDIDQW